MDAVIKFILATFSLLWPIAVPICIILLIRYAIRRQNTRHGHQQDDPAKTPKKETSQKSGDPIKQLVEESGSFARLVIVMIPIFWIVSCSIHNYNANREQERIDGGLRWHFQMSDPGTGNMLPTILADVTLDGRFVNSGDISFRWGSEHSHVEYNGLMMGAGHVEGTWEEKENEYFGKVLSSGTFELTPELRKAGRIFYRGSGTIEQSTDPLSIGKQFQIRLFQDVPS